MDLEQNHQKLNTGCRGGFSELPGQNPPGRLLGFGDPNLWRAGNGGAVPDPLLQSRLGSLRPAVLQGEDPREETEVLSAADPSGRLLTFGAILSTISEMSTARACCLLPRLPAEGDGGVMSTHAGWFGCVLVEAPKSTQSVG